MTGSITSAFGEPDDLETALSQECGFSLLITGRGWFRARLTQVALHRMWLLACQEHLPRIAFITVPGDKVLITFGFDDRPAPTWGGVRMGPGQFMSFGPGQGVHAWTERPVHWKALFVPVRQLTEYGRVLTGRTFT